MQPDKLFREKLENFELDTSSGAWSRVENGLESSPSRVLWIKIGAAVLIFAVSSVLIWNYAKPDHQNKIATQIPVQDKENLVNESQPITTKEVVDQVSPIVDRKKVIKNIQPSKNNLPTVGISENNIGDTTDKNSIQENMPVNEIISRSKENAGTGPERIGENCGTG